MLDRIIKIPGQDERGSLRTSKSLHSNHVPHSVERITWVIAAVACFYYIVLMTNGTFNLFGHEVLGLVFNSMFENMLHGKFTIDPEVLRYKDLFEAMVKDGKTYMYFGVFPALLRGLIAPLVDLNVTYVSRLSVLAGLFITVFFQVKAMLRVMGAFESDPFIRRLYYVTLIGVLFGSPYVFMAVNASVYHEPIIWASVAVAVFNYFLIDVAMRRDLPTLSAINAVAVFAGICLLSRVNVAIGIYVGLPILIFFFSYVNYHQRKKFASRLEYPNNTGADDEITGGKSSGLRLVISPLVILFIFGVAYLGINHARWGNPLMSAYFEGYAERSKSLEKYGVFNPRRIPFGVRYYVLGTNEHRKFTRTEGPRASMVATSGFLLLLGLYGAVRLFWLVRSDLRFHMPLIIGVASQGITVLLALMFAALTIRYRMDLWGTVSLCVMTGLYFCAQKSASLPKKVKTIILSVAAALTIIGVASSQISAARYKLMWLSMEKPSSAITTMLQSLTGQQ